MIAVKSCVTGAKVSLVITMNNKTSLLFILAFVALCAFAAGYWLGTEKTLRRLNTHIVESMTITNGDAKNIADASILREKQTQVNRNKPALNNVDIELNGTNKEDLRQTERKVLSTTLTLKEGASVIEKMEYLLLIGLSENDDDIDQFGPTLDSLKQLVAEDPDQMQILIDYFVDSDATTQAPYYFTSVLQGVDIQDKDLIINNMVNRLSAQGTHNANKKLLHLVSSTGAHHDNEQIIDSLKNIALYSQADDNNRTYALELLMPYQLSNDEKSKVVNDLSFALEQAPSEEVSYMVENIIRFSDKDDRIKLASNYLADTNDFSTRVAILSTLHNGSIKPNDTLKGTLFDIAENTNDPLSKHAKDTLMYVFEIDNNEYKRLRSGG